MSSMKVLKKKWEGDREYYDKYFLEFIGHILIKYKIKEMKMLGMIGGDYIYQSTDWKFNNIKKI